MSVKSFKKSSSKKITKTRILMKIRTVMSRTRRKRTKNKPRRKMTIQSRRKMKLRISSRNHQSRTLQQNLMKTETSNPKEMMHKNQPQSIRNRMHKTLSRGAIRQNWRNKKHSRWTKRKPSNSCKPYRQKKEELIFTPRLLRITSKARTGKNLPW